MTTIEPCKIDTLVTKDWLSQHLDDTDLVVLDCSISIQPDDDGSFQNTSGRAAYEAGHITVRWIRRSIQ